MTHFWMVAPSDIAVALADSRPTAGSLNFISIICRFGIINVACSSSSLGFGNGERERRSANGSWERGLTSWRDLSGCRRTPRPVAAGAGFITVRLQEIAGHVLSDQIFLDNGYSELEVQGPQSCRIDSRLRQRSQFRIAA